MWELMCVLSGERRRALSTGPRLFKFLKDTEPYPRGAFDTTKAAARASQLERSVLPAAEKLLTEQVARAEDLKRATLAVDQQRRQETETAKRLAVRTAGQRAVFVQAAVVRADRVQAGPLFLGPADGMALGVAGPRSRRTPRTKRRTLIGVWQSSDARTLPSFWRRRTLC